MNMRFIAAQEMDVPLLPWEEFVDEIPSTARVENYPVMMLPSGMKPYIGKMQWNSISEFYYSLENQQYRNNISFPLRDIEDATGNAGDQKINIYLKAADMLAFQSGRLFKNQLVMEKLAKGRTTNSLDNSNFFASSHNLGGIWLNGGAAAPPGFGGGGNLLTFPGTSIADSSFHRFIIMVMSPMMPTKPMFFQNRKPGQLHTNHGQYQSILSDKVEFFCRAEAAVGLAWWYQAIEVDITNTPSLLDLVTCIDGARQQFAKFTLQTKYSDDPPRFIHEQWMPDASNTLILSDPSLGVLFEHLLHQQTYSVAGVSTPQGGVYTSNVYQGKFRLAQSNYLTATS